MGGGYSGRQRRRGRGWSRGVGQEAGAVPVAAAPADGVVGGGVIGGGRGVAREGGGHVGSGSGEGDEQSLQEERAEVGGAARGACGGELGCVGL